MAPKTISGRTRIEKSWQTELLPVRVTEGGAEKKVLIRVVFLKSNALISSKNI